MDTVILAAGKGERLDGITAPYHKPLLVINGKPIVQQAVDFALQLGGNPIVVVAPENASPINAVLRGRPGHMVVQRQPDGPGRALLLGLEMARSEDVLVLMGDNVSTYADVSSVARAVYGVGIQLADRNEGKRFTYWRHSAAAWTEKIEPTDEDCDPGSGMITAWVGPLVVNRKMAVKHYRDNEYSTQIGPVIDRLAPVTHSFVPVSTYDIGVPEALV